VPSLCGIKNESPQNGEQPQRSEATGSAVKAIYRILMGLSHRYFQSKMPFFALQISQK
jgi:hypothetical protein